LREIGSATGDARRRISRPGAALRYSPISAAAAARQHVHAGHAVATDDQALNID